ncbi:MAG: ATP-binding cassette domain-containing protein [Gammaproteobacteria bacterium]|nr:ATP-binding cassette domain-containing protein [Gammaproteobacteria bacterium]
MTEQSLALSLNQLSPIPLDVELSCKTGEILVILGPSGSGKTTVLRSIAGLYTPKTGKISSNGSSWFDTEKKVNLSIQQRKVGFVFQEYALFPHLTALDNIRTALPNAEYSAQLLKAEELLERVNMQGLGDRYPNQLSGGQQQRVALARALARDPRVLLLDEPFSAVDQQTRRKLVRELLQLREQVNIPIIHVTHDLNEARRIADRICIIHRGNTLQIDTPQNIMARPLNRNVAHLVGHYNVFRANIEQHDEAEKLTYLRWHDYLLETNYRPEFEKGQEVSWVIPAENLILHRRDRPSKGERENPVSGAIEEFIPMGETVLVTIKVTNSDEILTMSVPTHVAQRNAIQKGGDLSVSLLGQGIHLMKE